MILKKLSYSLLFLLIWTSNPSLSLAQNCLPESIFLNSQQAVDAFAINYPDCTEIEGELSIVGNSITNLNGLSHITKVFDLIISNCGQLTNLSGLSSLHTVENNLGIFFNDNLKSLNGLENLETIDGILALYFNSSLESINGLSSIQNINNILINTNTALNSLDGLESIKSITDLQIVLNYNLENIEALSNLNSVKGSLIIEDNRTLPSLKGLESIQEIRSDLSISYNDSITNLNSFNSLGFIGGNIEIFSNDNLSSLSGFGCLDLRGSETLTISKNEKLTSLEAFESLELRSLTNITITENELLNTCDIRSLCDYISNGGEITLEDNGENCSDLAELKESCKSSSEQEIDCQGVPYPNPSNDFLMISCICDHQFNIRYKILDIHGREVKDGIFYHVPIDISMLNAGTYFIKFKNDKKIDLSFTFVKT